MRRWFYVLVVVAAAGLTACSIDADYGGTNLRCPPSSPRCPDGYTCVDQVCTTGGDGGGGADAPDAPSDGALTICERAAMAANNDACGGLEILRAAAMAAGGTTVYGNTATYANDLTPSSLPGCTTRPEPGPDAVYRMGLVAGDTLVVNLQPEFSTGDVYVTDGCASTATCRGGAMAFSDGTIAIATSGTYYVIVDAPTAGIGGCFALDVAVQ